MDIAVPIGFFSSSAFFVFKFLIEFSDLSFKFCIKPVTKLLEKLSL